jgi:hypothetical protein
MTKDILLHIMAFGLLALAIHVGNPWIAVIAAFIFVWTWFPRWRSRWYKLLDKAIGMLKGSRHHRCDPE